MAAIDSAALKAKYEAERDKRLRKDGNAQYVHLEGQFAHFSDDPYTDRTPREPMTEEVEVVVMGGGFGGLMVGAQLQSAGIDNFRIVERAGDFGGTWYWNRYPGAACDCESYIYLPLLEEVGYVPTEKYARAPEIFEYAKTMGRKFDLYRRAIFQTKITEVQWDEKISRWHVRTDRNDDILARFVVMCPGHYADPKLPGIPGIETFEGHSFHTSRWDFHYTGGDSLGGLTQLQDKTVGIIGTGATAVQCIPHLGRWAKQLHVFQRTPSGVDFRGDHPTDPEWAKSLTPGWQKRRMDNFTALMSWMPVEEDLIKDSWTKPVFEVMRKMSPGMTDAERAELVQSTDYRMMEAVRARVDAVIKDKTTAEALKPWYNRLCKRPCFHDDYLEAFNRPNVTLVDSAGRGVDRITEDSVVVAGREYKIDCLVYATGFDLAAFAGIPVPVYGRNGLALADKWKAGARTLHGIHSHGFPNFFVLSTIQSAWGPNFPHMMEEQSRHIAYVIQAVKQRGAQVEEVTAEAESEWVATHEQYSPIMLKIWAECTPSYYNNEGQTSAVIARNGGFGAGVFAMVDIFTKWRDAGTLPGLELRGA
jgi:cyclohexanone monooxygenase